MGGNGQPQSWWVEAADSQVDLMGHTGTNQLVVTECSPVSVPQWKERQLGSAVAKKFWRFYMRATNKGGRANVLVPDLELWSDDGQAPSQ